jgi:hypothetical protein
MEHAIKKNESLSSLIKKAKPITNMKTLNHHVYEDSDIEDYASKPVVSRNLPKHSYRGSDIFLSWNSWLCLLGCYAGHSS